MFSDRIGRMTKAKDDSLEVHVPLDDAGRLHRDTILIKKRRGMRLVILILVLACSFPLWYLRAQENIDTTMMWYISGIVCMIILAALFSYYLFARQVARDLLTNENLAVPAMVIDGWQVQERRDPQIWLNINGNRMEMAYRTMQRLVDKVTEIDNLRPGDVLVVEMAPHSRVLLRMVRPTGYDAQGNAVFEDAQDQA